MQGEQGFARRVGILELLLKVISVKLYVYVCVLFEIYSPKCPSTHFKD
jgi:hypothetical protein